MTKPTSRKRRMYKGLPVVDARKPLEFTVTKADVKAARRNDPAQCAAAVATRRELNLEADVHISRTYVKQPDGKAWVRYTTPTSIAREITSFDRSSMFEPGDYVVRPPSPGQCLGVRPGRGASTKGHGKTRPHHRTLNIRERAQYDKAIQ